MFEFQLHLTCNSNCSILKLDDSRKASPPVHCFLVKLINLMPLQGTWTGQIKLQMQKEITTITENDVNLGARFRHETPEFPLAVELWECDQNMEPIRPAFHDLIRKKVLKIVSD